MWWWRFERTAQVHGLATVPRNEPLKPNNRSETKMATKYPQYKIGQWIGTSEEAMAKPELTISYGVEIRPRKGEKWMHCFRNNKPLLFDTADEASAEIAKLKSAA